MTTPDKSGLGVSAGVPGFRVGTGPRGNYVHMGRHGVYCRAFVATLEVPVLVLGDDGLADHVRRPGAGEEVMVLVGYLVRGPNPP
jgi:hypothetical protein